MSASAVDGKKKQEVRTIVVDHGGVRTYGLLQYVHTGQVDYFRPQAGASFGTRLTQIL